MATATEPSAALDLPLTDLGNAEFFISMFAGLLRFDHQRRRWLVWSTHRWLPDDDATVWRMARESVRTRQRDALIAHHDGVTGASAPDDVLKFGLRSESRQRLSALIELAKTLKPIADSGRGWDETPGLLCVANGVVDLRTGVLRDGRPEDRITKQVPVHFDPEAACPRFRRFLNEILDTGEDAETAEVVRYVRRLLGYGLTGESTQQKVVFLMGVGGNGKSTLLDFYKLIAGDYGIEIAPTVIRKTRNDQHTTEVAALEGNRVATCEEVGDAMLNSDRLKHLSGGSSVSARRLYKEQREFRPTWQLWVTTNGQPKTDDHTWAFWRRVVALEFPNTFDPTDEPDLRDTLMGELPGILTGIVKGAVEFYSEGLGATPTSVEEHVNEYREDTDPAQRLLQDNGPFEPADGVFTTSQALFKGYQLWAASHPQPYPYGSANTLASALAGTFKRARPMQDDGTKPRGFVGVRLRA